MKFVPVLTFALCVSVQAQNFVVPPEADPVILKAKSIYTQAMTQFDSYMASQMVNYREQVRLKATKIAPELQTGYMRDWNAHGEALVAKHRAAYAASVRRQIDPIIEKRLDDLERRADAEEIKSRLSHIQSALRGLRFDPRSAGF